MSRGARLLAFLLLSIVAGPVTFFAASVIVLNAVRGAFLFLINIFEVYDFSFIPNLIAGGLSVAIAWGLLVAGIWLWRKTLPIEVGRAASYQRTTQIVLLTLLAASLAIALVVGLMFTSLFASTEAMIVAQMEIGRAAWVFLLILGALYMPIGWALFVCALAGGDRADESGASGTAIQIWSLILPVGMLVLWVILQWIFGGLF